MKEKIARLLMDKDWLEGECWSDWEGTGDFAVEEEVEETRNSYRESADQILTLICEEIGKALLTDEETRRAIGKDRKLKSVEDFRQVFADVAQAQLDKILALLQKTSMSSQKEGQ